MTTSLLLKSATVVLSALALGTVLFGRLHVNAEAPALPFDLLIANARIVDGSGNPWFRADIGIKDGRIVRIGRLGPEATRTIDARGQIPAPGFMDVHTHVESIYSLPTAENFVRLGVTTLLTGNCGTSTTDVAEFLGRINQKPLAVHLATLIAHGSVRRKVMGLGDREPTAGELAVTVDQYAYTASSTSLESRLPAWLRAGGLEKQKKRLADKTTRERAINDTKDALKRS
ncbi:MAG TPA: hypothetical protein VJW17_01685, partial [Pyrinomonadaceae bacterium]|nr:hypothetical protein [Pyrinomonadaceae bacterium]